MIRLELRSLGVVEETSTFLVVLHAPVEARVLLLEVGTPEGRAIAVESEELKTPRPLTHQLVGDLMHTLGARLNHVLIHRYESATFYSYLAITQQDGTELQMECRPSDAIAVALHLGAPLYVTPEVLAEAGQDEAEYEADIARIEELMEEILEVDVEEGTSELAADGTTAEAVEGAPATEATEMDEDEEMPVRTLRWLTKRTVH
ncbi:MAG TPA: bifunctional nuclease family protein [Symbiobacteriaceae bacterium]|nr:bifunctional nuclease family protein [Symbiobacteriaceae bacterium]